MNRPKVLFIATIFAHFRAFHIPYMVRLKDLGWQVDLMAGGESMSFDVVDNIYHIDIQRTPFSLKNINAYRQAKKVIDDGGYDVVYCHTAMGSVITRLASIRSRRTGKTKVVYVAHGFHFCKDSSKFYWLTYYPVEKFLSRYTDALVTINKEDYQLAQTRGFRCGALYKIDGIGVNLGRFKIVDREQKRELRREYNVAQDDFVMIYTAEHIARKNHKFIIDSAKSLRDKIPNLRILFAGRGVQLEYNKKYAQSAGVGESIEFLGYRTDIDKLVSMSDIVVSASMREGLPINIIEGLACGRPVVATRSRGHNDLIGDGNGFLVEQNDIEGFVKRVVQLHEDKELYAKMSKNAVQSAKKYNIEYPLEAIMQVFTKTTKK